MEENLEQQTNQSDRQDECTIDKVYLQKIAELESALKQKEVELERANKVFENLLENNPEGVENRELDSDSLLQSIKRLMKR